MARKNESPQKAASFVFMHFLVRVFLNYKDFNTRKYKYYIPKSILEKSIYKSSKILVLILS